jgi:iron complex transport system ATP-binding protein
MSDGLFEARGLTWDFDGRSIVGPLDLSIGQGECWAVIGPNGAGKTTLLRLLAGVLASPTGEVRHRGAELRRLSRRDVARRVAYVPQLRPLSVSLTVDELMLSGRYPFLSPWQWAAATEDRRAIDAALERVGLHGLRDRPLDRLSGGERQAAYIAAALVQEAEVLILDEPTTYLDPRHQREVADLLRALRDDGTHSLIVATHDLAFASVVADHVLALSAGLAFARGTSADVLRPETMSALFDADFLAIDVGAGRAMPMLAFAPETRRVE